MDEKLKFRYLLAGGINTVFGYFFSLFVNALVGEKINVFFVGVLAGVVNITFSFLSYKLFVFKTKGKFFEEYLKCYVVYGVSLLLGSAALVVLKDWIGLSFWLAQLLVIAASFLVSYLGHKNFTFRR